MNFSIETVIKQEVRQKTQNEKRNILRKGESINSPHKTNKSELYA